MRRRTFLLSLSLIVFFGAAIFVPGPASAEVQKVCVSEFTDLDNTGKNDWLGPFISDSIRNDLKVFSQIRIMEGKEPQTEAREGPSADATPFVSSVCASARAAAAQYAIGGNFKGERGEFLINTYIFDAGEERQLRQTSVVSSIPDLYARLDDLSVSLAEALGLAYSDGQSVQMHKIPSTSLAAMRSYGKALGLPPKSKERGDLLTGAVARDPHYTDALMKLGVHYYDTDRLAKAQEVLENLAEVDPDYPYVYYNLALVFRTRRHYSRAIEMYLKALSLQPEDSDAYNNLGIAYFLMGRPQEALDALKRAVETDPDDATARRNYELLAAKIGETPAEIPGPASSVSGLRESIEVGAALYASGDYWRAIESFQKALKIQPNNFKANNNIALAYTKVGELEKAREHFRRALEADPTAIDVSENLEKLKEQAAPSETSAQVQPDRQSFSQSAALAAAGRVYLSRGASSEAADAFNKALAISPDNADAINGLGDAYFAMGDYEKAREQFQKSLAIDPENADAAKKLKDIEFVLAATGEGSESEQPFVLSIPPEVEARARFVTANNFYEAGEYEKAVSEYRRALDLDPTSVEILNNLGNAYFSLQRYDQANAALKKARELDPDSEVVKNNLDVLAMAKRSDRPADLKSFEMFKGGLDDGGGETGPVVSGSESAENIPAENATQEKVEMTSDVRIQEKSQPTPAEPVEAATNSNASSSSQVAMNLQKEAERENARASYEPLAKSSKEHFNLGVFKEGGGDLEGAMLHYREAVRLDPKNANAQYNLGNIYFRLGAFESAIEAYLAAVEADPAFSRSYNNLGVAYYRLGRISDAREAWKRALEIDPLLESAHENLNSFGAE